MKATDLRAKSADELQAEVLRLQRSISLCECSAPVDSLANRIF